MLPLVNVTGQKFTALAGKYWNMFFISKTCCLRIFIFMDLWKKQLENVVSIMTRQLSTFCSVKFKPFLLLLPWMKHIQIPSQRWGVGERVGREGRGWRLLWDNRQNVQCRKSHWINSTYYYWFIEDILNYQFIS